MMDSYKQMVTLWQCHDIRRLLQIKLVIRYLSTVNLMELTNYSTNGTNEPSATEMRSEERRVGKECLE